MVVVGMEKEEYKKLRNERDSILKSGGRRLSPTAKLIVEEIREKLKNAHREQYRQQQTAGTNQQGMWL